MSNYSVMQAVEREFVTLYVQAKRNENGEFFPLDLKMISRWGQQTLELCDGKIMSIKNWANSSYGLEVFTRIDKDFDSTTYTSELREEGIDTLEEFATVLSNFSELDMLIYATALGKLFKGLYNDVQEDITILRYPLTG